MRILVVLVLAVALAVGVALFAAGCAKRTTEEVELTAPAPIAEEPDEATPEPAETGEETEEEKLARGEKVMDQYEDATVPPVDWSWSKDSPIDPASIPDEPAAGVMEGKVFRVKHAVMQQDEEEKTWDLRFLDVEPKEGEEHSFYFHDTDRHIELTIPEADKNVKIQAPFGSGEWDINKLWFWYQTPQLESPDGTSMNPNKSVALYLEFTDWDETPLPDNENTIGTAKGKIGVGSEMWQGESVCWLAGTFEAVIAKP